MSNKSEVIPESRDRNEYPLIRHIEAIPVSIRGKNMILLRDPAALTDKMLIVPLEVFFIISRLDGKHSIMDIQVEYNRKFGHLIFRNQVDEILMELDAALLLENDNYFKYMEFLKEEFKKQDYRDAALAGKSYPKEPEKLREELDKFFIDLPPDDHPNEVPIGIISPHIDFQRGGRTYGIAYRELKKSDAECFIIFGTSHHDVPNLMALTTKTFRTPLGDIPCDTDFVKELSGKCKTDFFADEYLHRNEHSIELQTVLLRYIFPDRNIKIVPILVGAFDDFAKEGKKPSDDYRIEEFIRAFKETLESRQQKTAFIAGVDFAHVGLAFGDMAPPTSRQLKDLEEDERYSIKFIEQMDAEGFFADVIAEQEERRVCGLSPIYMMMRCINADRGRLLEYRQCLDPMGYANVAIAAIGFY